MTRAEAVRLASDWVALREVWNSLRIPLHDEDGNVIYQDDGVTPIYVLTNSVAAADQAETLAYFLLPEIDLMNLTLEQLVAAYEAL